MRRWRGIKRPVAVCADESVHDRASLDGLRDRYDAVNIKLDKTGGLTEALAMADAAQALGFDIMIGCMVATSLAMAPAMLLAQQARFVDLDGPLAAGARPRRRLALRRQSGLSAGSRALGMSGQPHARASQHHQPARGRHRGHHVIDALPVMRVDRTRRRST